MYRELVISLVIVLSIFVLDYITQKYTDKAINEAIQDLTQIKEIINKEDINGEEVEEKINQNYEKWLRHHKILAFYIEHNELEKVETNYVTGKCFVETAQYEEANSELEKTIFVLKHINDKYSINLENIF